MRVNFIFSRRYLGTGYLALGTLFFSSYGWQFLEVQAE